MLKEISLKNFKSFANLNGLEIRPLTILCGVNSGGKSSILKSLLLLKQSYENYSSSNEATLNGTYTTNGTMKDVLYNGKGNTFSISNKFIVEYRGKKFNKNSKQDVSTGKELGKITKLDPNQVSYFSIDVSCSIKSAAGTQLWDTNYIEKYEIEIIPFSKDGNRRKNEEIQIKMQYRTGGRGKYDIVLNNFPTLSEKRQCYDLKNCTCYFSGMRLTNLYYVSNDHSQPISLNDFLTNLYSIFRIVSDQYRGIKYLGSLRDTPQRQYVISNNYSLEKCTGADTPFILAKEQNKKVISELYPPLLENNFIEKSLPEKNNLIELVKEWMSYFELGRLEIKNNSDTLQVNIKDNNIADVGFGLSQILPIIVHGSMLDFEQTLILEQPEIHLHPRMQMRMADFLLSLAQTNHCVIAETHSDHIINRLVRRALEAKDEDVINNIAIYFVDNSDIGSTIAEIKIDRICGITSCPDEFFSQFASETSFIVNAGINNMTKEGL